MNQSKPLEKIAKVTPESLSEPNVQPFDLSAYEDPAAADYLPLLKMRRNDRWRRPGDAWLYVVLGLA